MLLNSIHAGLQVLVKLAPPREVLVLRRHEHREVPQELRLLFRIQFLQFQPQFGIRGGHDVLRILQLALVLVECLHSVLLAYICLDAHERGVIFAFGLVTFPL
jgi:hypothetical protein